MRKLLFGLFTFSVIFLCGCTEEVDTSARYVFSIHTVASYLEAHDSVYSEYLDMLRKVTVSPRSASTLYQLMTARGNYTCFVPTNEAIHNYLQDLTDEGLISEPSWEAFRAFPDSSKLDSIRNVIVMNSIIDGKNEASQRYLTFFFPTENNGEFPIPNMNDHKLTVSWATEGNEEYQINGECEVDSRNRDIQVINGIIHQVHKVIAPKDETLARFIQNILDEQREGYLMFAKAVQVCGLLDTFSVVRDEVYEQLYQTDQIPDMQNYQDKGGGDMSATPGDPDAHAPEHRKYGFTLFCETDDYWRSQGIDPAAPDAPQQLQAWIVAHGKFLSDAGYQDNEDYLSPRNMLHQWVMYHILPMRIPANKLVYHCNEVGYSLSTPYRYSIPVYEWYPVMGGGRLIKIYESAESKGIYLNRFPVLRNGIKQDGHEDYCDPAKEGCLIRTTDSLTVVNDVVNACIYPIDRPLAYNDDVRENMSKERIRFDLFSLFPEAITNGIRRADSPEGRWQHVYIPQDRVYKYFENMSILNEETHFIHYNGYRTAWANYCQDEDKAFGHFDIMFRLPPVPMRNTYEFRYKLLATAARGIVQVYFGNDPNRLAVAGIPIDMTKGVVAAFGENASWGDLRDDDISEDDIINIDHKLRNHDLMKGSRYESELNHTTSRDKENCLRRIIVRQTLDPGETYYVRFKSVLDSDRKELYLDYFEYCPKEVYDSPERPEDIW